MNATTLLIVLTVAKDIVLCALVVGVVAIVTQHRIERNRLWHETVRLALEKGQPFPSTWPDQPSQAPALQTNYLLLIGLVLIATAVGVYLTGLVPLRHWAPLPGCIGVAFLIAALFSRRDPRNDTSSTPPRGQ